MGSAREALRGLVEAVKAEREAERRLVEADRAFDAAGDAARRFDCYSDRPERVAAVEAMRSAARGLGEGRRNVIAAADTTAAALRAAEAALSAASPAPEREQELPSGVAICACGCGAIGWSPESPAYCMGHNRERKLGGVILPLRKAPRDVLENAVAWLAEQWATKNGARNE